MNICVLIGNGFDLALGLKTGSGILLPNTYGHIESRKAQMLNGCARPCRLIQLLTLWAMNVLQNTLLFAKTLKTLLCQKVINE